MSVEFSNAYQEILLENLMGVIKQNFLFQTQLKLNEGLEKQKNELMVQLEDIKTQFASIQNQTSELNVYKMKAEQNSAAHEEKSRIQSALNEELKKSNALQSELDQRKNDIGRLENEKKVLSDQKEKEISELKSKISQLEELVPVTKLKKLSREQPKEEPKQEVKKVEEIKKVEVAIDPQQIKPKQETKAVIDRFIPISVQGGGTF